MCSNWIYEQKMWLRILVSNQLGCESLEAEVAVS